MFIEYLLILSYLIIVCLLGFILFYISWFFSTTILGRRRFAIYECGFRAFSGNYKPFTAQYYIIALIFLLFDIELLYMFPWLLTLKYNILQKSFFILWVFSFFLIISYLYEILKGSLKWYDGSNQIALKRKLNQYRSIN